jgi:hypothetical protein
MPKLQYYRLYELQPDISCRFFQVEASSTMCRLPLVMAQRRQVNNLDENYREARANWIQEGVFDVASLRIRMEKCLYSHIRRERERERERDTILAST